LFKKRIVGVLILISICIGLTGCGGGSGGSNSGNGDKGGNSDVVTANAEAGAKKEAGGSSSISEAKNLPDGFPKEIPIIKGAESTVAFSSEKSITVAYEVKSSFEEALAVYKGYYKSAGYTDLQEIVIDDSYSGTGVRSGKQLLVSLSVFTEDSNLVSVSITYKDQDK